MAFTEASSARIGLVIGQLTYGGAEGQLFELARGLAERGRAPTVYCLSARDEPYGSRLREAGVPVRVLPSRGSFDLARVWRLRQALRRDGVSLVHSFLFLASGYAYLATRGTGLALVSSARNCKPEPHPLRRWLLRRAFAASDAVICNSREMARYAQSYYRAPQARLRVVLNGVDTGRFVSASPSDGGLRIGTVGRIEAQKNLGVFLDAAAIVVAARPDARFVIVGEGSLRAHFEAEIRRRGLQDVVQMPGTRSDVNVFLAGLDQFWLTSDWEGTPNVVLEAMACGLPSIVTRVGGTPEIVDDGRSGFLVGVGDAASIARHSLRLAGDPGEAARVGAAARAAAEDRFSIAAMVRETETVYAEASAGKSR